MAIREDGEVRFETLEPEDLATVFVVAQCLDNQWVPQTLLDRMVKNHESLADVQDERDPFVRGEYLRSLVNARQVVMNRAYLYNNPVVFSDYLKQGPNRDAFKEFLEQRVVVPYFFNETSPIDRPRFATDPRGFPAWETLCREATTRCVRLSWNDDANKKLIADKLSRRFHDFAATIYSGDPEVFVRDLGLRADALPELKKTLPRVAQACLEVMTDEDRHITREDLYKRFVVADGSPPSEGQYDSSKSVPGAIKQLLDLRYNVNLPDALGGYPLTPVDSLHRTALQEWQAFSGKPEVTADELLTLIRRSTFDILQGGLFLKSFAKLELADVQELRRTDEWADYIRTMERLIEDPLSFPDSERGAQAVYGAYTKLATEATKLAASRKAEDMQAGWAPVIEVIFDVAGAVLSLLWSGDGVSYAVAGTVSSRVSEKSAPLLARLAVRGLARGAANADLSTSIDFMQGQMHHAERQWEALIRGIGEFKGIGRRPDHQIVLRDPNINHSEQL